MILKSKSRSNKSFAQLYNYFTKEKETPLYGYNLYANRFNKSEVVSEFEKNSEFLNRSLGKNFLYHEILSLGYNGLEQELQQEALIEMAYKYLELRAKNHLVLMAIHKEKNHLHMHIMISANEIYGTKRKRLSKSEFAKIQASLESFQNSHYEDLQTFHYQDISAHPKQSSKEQELKSRGKISQKERVSSLFMEILANSKNIQEFKTRLMEADIELYTRGKNEGLVFEEKKYRLSTLKLSELYHDKLFQWEQKNELESNNKSQFLKTKEFIKESLAKANSKKEFIETLYGANYEFYERQSDGEIYINSKWYTLNSFNLAREYQTKKRTWDKNKDFKSKTSFRDENLKRFEEYEQQL